MRHIRKLIKFYHQNKVLSSLLLGLLTLVLGVIGFFLQLSASDDTGTQGLLTLLSDSLYSTLLLFAFAGDVNHDTHWLVHIARLMAIAITSSAIISLIWHQLNTRTKLFLTRCWNDHTVIIGLGERGYQFAISANSDEAKVIAIDPVGESAKTKQLQSMGIVTLEGYGQDKALLAQLSLSNAKHIIVVASDDATNIEVAQAVSKAIVQSEASTPFQCKACLQLKHGISLALEKFNRFKNQIGQSSDNNAPSNNNEQAIQHTATNTTVTLFVHIDGKHIRQSFRDQHICLEHSNLLRLEPFSGRELIATEWLRKAQLHDYARTRGEQQLHLVFVGLNTIAMEIIHHLVRVLPCPGFKPARLSLLLADTTIDDNKTLHSDSLLELLAEYPALDDLVNLNLVAYHPTQDQLNDNFLADIEQNTPVSAIVVSLSDDKLSSNVALRLRAATCQNNRWRAPIYVHLRKRSGLESAICSTDTASRFTDVIEPFGTLDAACTINALVQFRDRLPRQMHEAYQRHHVIQPEKISSQPLDKNLHHWDQLQETFRASNRRQANHIPVKLSWLGLTRVNDQDKFTIPLNNQLSINEHSREQLARVEHESWANDRLLEGWKPALIKDIKRHRHNTLIPFDNLSEAYKDYDRQAVDLLCSQNVWKQDDDNPAWRPEVRIALIGHNRLSQQAVKVVEQTIRESLLPDIVERYPSHLLTFITPLAPGSDLTLAQATHETLRAMKQNQQWKGEHRLLILETVPREAVIDDYQSTYESGAWPSSDPMWASRPDWATARSKLLDTLQTIEQQETTPWIIELSDRGQFIEDWQDSDKRVAGYERAALWMVENADELVAVVDSRREGGVGGTQATLEAWECKKDVLACVVELDHLGPT